MEHTYEIKPRHAHLGGGWSAKLYEDGEEIGGAVFPIEPGDEITEDFDKPYQRALDFVSDWLESF